MNALPQRRREHGPARCAGERGYTLVELLSVIVVVGIVAAMAVPRFDLTPMRLGSAVHEATGQVLTAQRLAVARQHDVVLAFDTAGSSLRLHMDADNDGVIDDGEAVTFHPVKAPLVLGRGGAPAATEFGMGRGPEDLVRRQGGYPALVFHRNGSASQEGGFYLTSVRAQRGEGHAADARAVRVERSTGRASWYEWTGSRWREGSR